MGFLDLAKTIAEKLGVDPEIIDEVSDIAEEEGLA